MDHFFPRTIAEFMEHGRRVIWHCERCRKQGPLSLDVLDATFGSAFDLYAGLREMRGQLYCPHCGAERPRISFFNPEERHGEVSFEDSVTHQLEFNAYVRASADGPLPEPVHGPRRRRR